MAKGLRASVKKSNRTKLRSTVFGPVEAARAERLHAKLLETISQPKPEPAKKDDMDADSADAHKHDAELPKGSCFLTAKIPRTLSDPAPNTTALDPKAFAQDNIDSRNFYLYLGLCSDIVGFTDEGNLKFAFDALPQHGSKMELEIDGTRSTSASSNKKRVNKSKLKKLRKPRNSITFPQTRGKGALKPFSESRVRKRK
ncbi:hypothetical protein K505DRAFT_300541 [Melanomma pulvis-pyrius CBS 109.77]|uniref:DUF2423 domain-containing protein n=1 Tax=Melanomma pulvis-pyrius CBS 109.77 TaxID=1314802 RepID=A0A6A6XLB3_9PLEO|nr:hypothetical protein K505DRAFT_300541 [Melanomma pulvis-pyrius CBS 109.77]